MIRPSKKETFGIKEPTNTARPPLPSVRVVEDMECKHRQVEILMKENERLKKALAFCVDDVGYA